MTNFKLSEKTLKHNLKKEVSISTALIVTFLISGIIPTNLEARDLRNRNVIQVSESSGVKMSLSENNTDIIDIVNPKNGISHNKYNEFNVGEGNNVIFNNSKVDGKSVTGGEVKANPNLNENAKVILNEVKGNSASQLKGGIEVFGKRADFILANENGINLNGANFINTSGVILSTAKVSVNENKIFLDSSKGAIKVQEKGMKTDSDYLNLISKVMEINGDINSKSNKNTDIDLIAGNNRIILDNKNRIVEKTNNNEEKGLAISASHLGSMYGKNISILSTDEGLGVKYNGNILASGNVDIEAKGEVSTSDIEAENIKIKSTKEAVNTGNVVAKQDIKLNAPLVKNLSQLKGTVRFVEKEDGKKITNRDRGIVYYDYHLIINNLGNIENTLNLKKAILKAGNNLIINDDLDNASFENIGGDISAGQILKGKGNFKSYDLSKELKLEEVLDMIKVDLSWEHRSLVDNAYFNGDSSLKSGSLLEALHIMKDKKNDRYYGALKQINDPTLNSLLSAYLGADWKAQNSIKEESTWNKNEILYFYANENSNVSAKNIYLEGKEISLGNKNKSELKEKIKINNYEIENNKAILENKKNASMYADNIVIQAGNFENNNFNMKGKEKILINSDENIKISGSEIKAEDILLDAKKDIKLSTELGYSTDTGKKQVSKKMSVEAENSLGMQGQDITLEATTLTTGEKGKIAIKGKSLEIKDLKVIDVDYNAQMIEGERERLLKNHQYTKETKATSESEASIIKGNTVSIAVDKDILIEGASITGVNKDSNIYIQSTGNTIIKNTEEFAYSNYFSDARGKDKNGRYRLLAIDKNKKEEMKLIHSILKSEGNINIQSKNLDIIASRLQAKNDISLRAKENLNILAALNKAKEELFTLKWGSGAINSYKKSSEKEIVESSEIKAGNKLETYAGIDSKNVSSILEGKSVNTKAEGKTINSALADREKIDEEKVDAGFEISGSVGLAGMGASGSINTLENIASSEVVGIDGLLADSNKFKEAHAKTNVSFRVNSESKSNETVKYKNNKIVAKEETVNIDSKGITDIGNTDIISKKNSNISGDDVITTSQVNTTKEVTNTVGFKLGADAQLSNETVTKISNLVNDAAKIKNQIDKKEIPQVLENVLETSKEVKQLVESLPEISKKDILGIKAKEELALSYNNITNKISETTANSIISEEGNVNITARKGDIILKNTHIEATEKVNLKAKNDIKLLSGEKKSHEEKNGLTLGTKVVETVGVSVIDGVNAKIGVEANVAYNGSSDVRKESLNTDIKAKEVNKEAKNVIEDAKTSFHYKDERELGTNVDLKVGVSSNHVVAVDGKVAGNGNYSFDIQKAKEEVNGAKESMQVNGGVKGSASIGLDGKNPDFSIDTKDFNYKKNDNTVFHLPATNDLITKEKIDKIIDKVTVKAKIVEKE